MYSLYIIFPLYNTYSSTLDCFKCNIFTNLSTRYLFHTLPVYFWPYAFMRSHNIHPPAPFFIHPPIQTCWDFYVYFFLNWYLGKSLMSVPFLLKSILLLGYMFLYSLSDFYSGLTNIQSEFYLIIALVIMLPFIFIFQTDGQR